MKATEIFKDQLERKQKASANAGTKTYFGKELASNDHILYFIYMKSEGNLELTKACSEELELFDSKLEQVVNKDGSNSSLLGSLPVFKTKSKK
jgi:hypothetical protein